jgi:hypothetical protein
VRPGRDRRILGSWKEEYRAERVSASVRADATTKARDIRADQKEEFG